MKNCFKKIRGKKGFTLVELVVVVGIAAVMMVIIMSSLLNGNTEEILSANTNACADQRTAYGAFSCRLFRY